jgi:peptidoglycan/xylan/chitin deacetylase (PgdA/CDA1 family)
MAFRPKSWLRQGAKQGLAAVLPRRWFLVRGPRRSGAVCLTFDDGPDPEATPRVLDVLAHAGVPATFFVIGREAERHPDLVRRMAAEGHAVGSHSYSHPAREDLTSRELTDEAARGAGVVAGILGKPPPLYRPPRGKVTAADLWRLWRAGLTTVLWNADPKDFSRPTADEVRDWFRARPLRGGDLVLLHDTCPHAPAVLPELIAGARDRGLAFTTVEAWVE